MMPLLAYPQDASSSLERSTSRASERIGPRKLVATTDHEETGAENLDARGRIEEALDGLLDRETLNVLVKEVLAVTKQSRGWCPNCNKAVPVSIPDSKTVVTAISELLVQAKGRPGTEPVDDQQTTVNIFYVTGGDGPEEVSHNGKVVEDPVEASRLLAEARNGATE